ncbi:MAG: F0F1 ATP synthase subunit epsilon [Bacteroidetes bacterium]|nr:F0F1 ATP synthase subunit epsilon [Bacteroidota bacterium]
MSTIQLEIVSAERDIFSGQASMVVAPGKDGDLGIAPKHTPLLTTLRPGDIEVHKEGGDIEYIYVTGGILEVQPHIITVLADSAQHVSELDEEAVLKAKNDAEELLKGASKKEDLEHAQAQLAEAAARYSSIKRLKGKK